MGLIHNPLSVPIIGIRIRVSLVTVEGLVVLSQEIAGARQWLPASASAPYGALFTTIPTEPTGAVAEVVQAEPIQNSMSIAIPLITHHLQGGLSDNRYRIEAVIQNATTFAVQPLIVITFLDIAGHVTGFRQISPEQHLAANSSLPIEVDGIAVAPGASQFTISADGLLLQTP